MTLLGLGQNALAYSSFLSLQWQRKKFYNIRPNAKHSSLMKFLFSSVTKKCYDFETFYDIGSKAKHSSLFEFPSSTVTKKKSTMTWASFMTLGPRRNTLAYSSFDEGKKSLMTLSPRSRFIFWKISKEAPRQLDKRH